MLSITSFYLFFVTTLFNYQFSCFFFCCYCVIIIALNFTTLLTNSNPFVVPSNPCQETICTTTIAYVCVCVCVLVCVSLCICVFELHKSFAVNTTAYGIFRNFDHIKIHFYSFKNKAKPITTGTTKTTTSQ